MEKFDVVVIGAGPGGVEAAIQSDSAGFRTALIEKEELGGVCLNWGCIPTKALLASSKLFSQIKHADQYGISNVREASFDIQKAFSEKDRIVSMLKKGIEWQLGRTKVTRFKGEAKLADHTHIEIHSNKNTETVEAKQIILATGSKPKAFPGFPFDGKNILSSTDLLALPEIPKSLVIVGAGAVGVEFASFYHAFGAQVTILEALPRLLPLEDEEIGKRLEMIYKKRGIQVQTASHVIKIQPETGTMRVLLDGGNVAHGDKVLIAIGRERNFKNMGLEAIGLKFNGTAIETNDYLETSVSNIFAIGDLIAAPQLAHAAIYEARLVISNLKASSKQKIRYDIIPNVTFSDPPVASVGISKTKARQLGHDVLETKVLASTNGKAWVERETEGFAKLMINPKSKYILGASIIGLEAPELIGVISLAILKGFKVNDLAEIIFPHPTASEILGDLAREALKSR